MQLLYERLSGGEADDESLDLVYEQLSMAQPEGSARLKPSKDERQYISDVLTGVQEHESELDDSIEKHSTGAWALSRVPHVDLSILRLAAYELYHRTGTGQRGCQRSDGNGQPLQRAQERPLHQRRAGRDGARQAGAEGIVPAWGKGAGRCA